MNALKRLHHAVFDPIENMSPLVLSTLARFIFAATLFMYYWNSAQTKLGKVGLEGLYNPTFNAFAQMFPKGAEAAGYDIAQATLFQKAVILSGTWAEFILPVLIIIGLFTRYAAVGMVAFIVVQSVVDLFGHGGIDDPKVLGAWFDGAPDGVILDQRAFWVFLMLYLVFRGAGPLSLDRLIAGKSGASDEYA